MQLLGRNILISILFGTTDLVINRNFSRASRYCSVFRDMRQSFDTFISNDPEEIILADSASALWSLQISNMHKALQSPSGKQVVFMDNYYT